MRETNKTVAKILSNHGLVEADMVNLFQRTADGTNAANRLAQRLTAGILNSVSNFEMHERKASLELARMLETGAKQASELANGGTPYAEWVTTYAANYAKAVADREAEAQKLNELAGLLAMAIDAGAA